MARYQTTIETALDVDEAWDRVSDVSRFAQWDPGVYESVQIGGDGPGPNASYELTVRGIKGRMELRYEVYEYAPPNRLFIVADTGGLRSEDEISVEPAGDGSVVTYRADLRFDGMYAFANPALSMVFKLIGRRAGKGLRAYLHG